MLQCLSLKKGRGESSCFTPSTSSMPTTSPPPPFTNNLHTHSQGTSMDVTPRSSSTQQSPSNIINVTREYTLAVQSNSYNEMWSRIHHQDQIQVCVNHHHDDEGDEEQPDQILLPQVLQPTRQLVEEALQHAKRNKLTRLVSTYFDNTESTTNLCLLLHNCVSQARLLYNPLQQFLEVLPLDLESLTQSQCQLAYEIFAEFDCLDNPFSSPDSQYFHDMRSCFSLLREQLDHNLCKSRSRARLRHWATVGSVLCAIGSVVAVIVTAVTISTHALVAFIATPVCSSVKCLLPKSKFTEKELAYMKQLDAAARGTYVLNNDLDTIDRLVAWLYATVEGDKQLVKFGLERGVDRHPLLEVLKQLRRNQLSLLDKLKELDERICLCSNAVNRARSSLLQKIHLYQTSNPGKH